MKNNGWWVFLCMMLAFVAPVRAEVNDNLTANSAALSTGNSSKGLAIVRQAFAELSPDQSAEATTLIQSILADAPMELSGQVVVTAIEGNPALGNAILAAISSTSQTEQLAILSRVSFVASREPESFSSVSGAVPKLLSSADANVPVSARLTSPAYNPSNMLSETGVALSPNRPGLRNRTPGAKQDQKKLEVDVETPRTIVQAHKPVTGVITGRRSKISNERMTSPEIKKDLQQD